MEGSSNDGNKFTTNINIQDFADKGQLGVALSGDAMMSLAGASMYATIAQAEFNNSNNAEPEIVNEIDKKRMRDKTRKDKIRQGIHKLSELLPTQFHSKEGQKETLVSILEKAAEFMQSMTKPEQELLAGGTGQTTAEKLPGDVLNELKTLDAMKSDKELGEMEDALSLMASSVAEQAVNSMSLTGDKMGNNNTLEMVTGESQENNMTLTGQGQGDTAADIGKTFLNMQGLGDQSFMAGMGGNMFADGGPLLPSLMSPMMPGSQMGGMLGAFQGVNSNMMQNTNLGQPQVNNGGNNTNTQATQQNVNSVPPFNTNFNQDGTLFASPATLGGGSTQSGMQQNNTSVTSRTEAESKTNIPPSQLVIKPESSEQSALQMLTSNTVNSTQSNSAVVTSVPAQDPSHLHNIGSIALFTQPSSMQQTLNTSAVNSSIHMSSTSGITPTTNVHINSNNISGTNFLNLGGGQSLQLQNVSNTTMMSTNTATVAANAGTIGQNQKPMNSVLNQMQVMGHPQVNTAQQSAGITQLNQGVTLPQVQGQTTTLGPVAPLQGTLVLHNNQLILVPNNQQQQQQQSMVNTGIAVNQNLQANLVNQSGVPQQTGVIGANLGGHQSVMNAGIQGTNNIPGVQASIASGGMQNVIGLTSQAQGLQKAGVITATSAGPQRLNLGQQQQQQQQQSHPQGMVGNAVGNTHPGVMQQGNQGGNTGTVQVNTPLGMVQMNTAPSAPNQLPSALILPNGQIVPVVTQPNVMQSQQQQQQQQSAVAQAGTGGNNLVLQGNQINQQNAAGQSGGQLTIQTPNSALAGGNQIIGCSGTGLLMTTASSQIIRQSSVTTLASTTNLKTISAQPNSSMQYIQGAGSTSSVIPGGAGLIKGPMITVTTKAQPIIAHTKHVVTSKTSSKSGSSKSKSKKSMMTSLPTTVQAMLTPEGNIILSLPAGAAAGAVLGKPLTPVSAVCTGNSKTPTTAAAVGVSSAALKKVGQRIIMPKPTSGAPVATIAPLLPGQSTNLMVTNAVAPTPTITTQCFPKGNTLPNSINPLAICVSSAAPVAMSTPPVCAQVTTSHHQQPQQLQPQQPPQPPSTDILAKAAESIFQASPANTGMSPNFYNPSNDDNPLQIDDANVSAGNNSHAQTVVTSTPQINTMSKTNATQPVLSVVPHLTGKSHQENMAHGGAKPKTTKPKKASKPSKKKAKAAEAKGDATSQFASIMASGSIGHQQQQHQPTAQGKDSNSQTFQMATDHFMPDLADNLDDGDDESDINDFQDLLRFHDQKQKSSANNVQPQQQQSNSLTELIAETTSCNVPPPTSSVDNVLLSRSSNKPEYLQKVESGSLQKSVCDLESSDSIMGLLNTTKKDAKVSDSNNTLHDISTCVSSTKGIDTLLMSTDISPSTLSSSNSGQLSPASVSSNASFAGASISSGSVLGDISTVSTLATSVESLPMYTSASTSHSYTMPLKSTTVTSVLSPIVNSTPDFSNSALSIHPTEITPPKAQAEPSDITRDSSITTSPQLPPEMMGLTPMEIIQNIAESSGKEKSPKQNKEPSPRISQKKLAKAGKGPPSTRREIPKSPKRAEPEPSKSPKAIDNNIFQAEAQIAADLSKTSLGFKPDDRVDDRIEVEPEKSQANKSPKKPSPRKSNKAEKVKPAKSKTQSKNTVKEVVPPISDQSSASVNTKNVKSTGGSKKSKAKGKGANREDEPTKDLKLGNDDNYPDEPPTLEKEEPFVPPKINGTSPGKKVESQNTTDRNDYVSQEKRRLDKKEENIFMNAITSDKPPSFFNSTPASMFPPAPMAPFSSASLPPPPFGFGNPPLLRFPMMTNASGGLSGGLSGFQHHLPMFAQPPSLFSNNFGKLPFKLPDQSPGRGPEVQEPPLYKPASESGKISSDAAMADAKDKKRKKKSKKEKRKDKYEKSEDIPSRSEASEQLISETSSVNVTSTSEIGHIFGSSVADKKIEVDDKPKDLWKPESSDIGRSELSQTDKLFSETQGSSFPDKQATTDSLLVDKKKRKDKKRKKDKRKRDKSESEYEFEIVQHSMISEESENKESEMTAAIEEECDESINASQTVVTPVIEEPVAETDSVPPRKSRSRSRKKNSKGTANSKEQVNKPEHVEIAIQADEPEEREEPLTRNPVINDMSPSKDSRKSYSLRGRGLSPKGVLEEPPELFEEDPALIRREDPNYDDMPLSPEEPMTDFSTVKISPLKADIVAEEKKSVESKPKPAPRKGRSRSRKGKNVSQEKVEEKTDNLGTTDDNFSLFASETENKGKAKGIKLKISSRSSCDSPSKVSTPQSVNTDNDYDTPLDKLVSPVQANTKGGRYKNKLDRSPTKSTPKACSTHIKTKFQEEAPKSKSIDVFDFEDEPDDLPCTLKSFSSKHKDSTQTKPQKDSDVFSLAQEESKTHGSPSRQPALKLTLGKGKGKKKALESAFRFPEPDNVLSSEFADSEPSMNTTCESIPDMTQKVKKTKKTVKSKKKSKHQEELTSETLLPERHEAPVETTDSELNLTQEVLEVKKETRKTKGKASKKAKSHSSEKEISSAVVNTGDNSSAATRPDSLELDTVSDKAVTSDNMENTNSERDAVANKKKDVFGHSGLEKTIKALHERLQSTSPVRIPVIPALDHPFDLTEKKSKQKSRKRTRESSQSESEALDLSVQDNRSMDSSANKTLLTNIPSSQSESNTKDVTLSSASEAEQSVFKPHESKKSKKPRKRGKDEAGLDTPVFQKEEEHIHSEPTPAKVKKSEALEKASSSVANSSETEATGKSMASDENKMDTTSSERVKDKKSKKKSSSKGKHHAKPDSSPNGQNISSDGTCMPDQITFTENDLFAVLDQVEGQGNTDATEPEPTPTATSAADAVTISDDSSPHKKPRLEIDESAFQEEDFTEEPKATEIVQQRQNPDAQALETRTTDVTVEEKAMNEVTESSLPSDSTSSAQEISPSKKEKKRDRKKRRKEKHMVKDMSECDLPSRESLTVIDSIQVPEAPPIVTEKKIDDTVLKQSSLPVNTQPTSSNTILEQQSAEDNLLATKATESSSINTPSAETLVESTSVSKEPLDREKSKDVTTVSSASSSSGKSTSVDSKFKVPHPVPDLTSVPARGNPPRPLERTSSTSHLVARIPKKRIDAYQKEYSKATQQSDSANSSITNAIKASTNFEEKNSNTSMDQLDSLNGKSMIESLSQANACVSDFSYGSDKTDTDMDTTTTLTSFNNVMTSDMNTNNGSTTGGNNGNNSLQDTRKENDSYSHKMSSKLLDLDYIPPSPLSSARHSHLGSLAQVASMRAQSIVMPASPRTPMSTIGSKSSRKDNKEKAEKRDQQTTPSEESTLETLTKPVSDVISSVNAANSSIENQERDNIKGVDNKSKSDDNLVTDMAPPTMLPAEKPMEKDLKNDDLPAPYSPEVNYSAEPLFSPPSILPPDSVHQEHEHSPTMPDPIVQKPKDASPAPAPAQMYPPTNYMNSNQGVDLSQRGMYGQEANAGSSTCALQAAKQGMYDNFSPPYASQASSGPSPSMGSNPGSNQMLSPNMNSSVVNTATTTSYTSTTANTQMANQRYPGYYMPTNSGNQQATPGPPPPLTMQQYGMEPQRDRQQNRTPGMSSTDRLSDRMTSPHPANQPKNYTNYMAETPAPPQPQQQQQQPHNTQQRDTQRLAHPEKEATSRRNSHGSGGHSHSNQSGHTHSSGGHPHSNQTAQMPTGQVAQTGSNPRRSSTGRSPVMNTDNRGGSSHNSYYPQTSYSGHSASQMTSPPLHHRGPAPSEQNTSSQRSSFDAAFSNTNAAYQSLASYSSYDSSSLPISGNSSSSHNQTVQQQQQQQQQTQKAANPSQNSAQSAKNLSSKQQQQASSSSSHARQQQQRQAQQQHQQQHSMQQSVKSSANRSSSSSSSSKNSKKASSASSKSAYDMDQTMMNSMFDPSRGMSPYFAFPNLHSPSSRNFHTEANPYFSGMFGNHQRQSSQHKGSDMNNPFMFAHSRSQNGIGLSWGGMNHAHSNHTPTTQNSHTNSQTPHLSGFNFNLFGATEMNSSHSQEGINLSPIKLSHGNLLGQHGMDHNAALQHQSLYQNRGQMPPSMLQHPMSFLSHQHPGFDGRSMPPGSMGAHFGGHGHGFGMPFLPD